MPSMKAKLRPEDATLLVGLIRNFKGGRQVVPDETDAPTFDSAKPPEVSNATDPVPSSARSPRTASASTSESAVLRVDPGRGLFQRLCVSCHGRTGQGDAMGAGLPRPPDFAAADWQSTRSDAQLMSSIREGKGSAMPAFGGKLGDAQVRDVIAYIRSFSRVKGSPIPKPPSVFRGAHRGIEAADERIGPRVPRRIEPVSCPEVVAQGDSGRRRVRPRFWALGGDPRRPMRIRNLRMMVARSDRIIGPWRSSTVPVFVSFTRLIACS